MKIRTYTRKAAFKIKFYTTHIITLAHSLKNMFQMAHKIAQIVTNRRSKNEILATYRYQLAPFAKSANYALKTNNTIIAYHYTEIYAFVTLFNIS